jgi:hypothetical protein
MPCFGRTEDTRRPGGRRRFRYDARLRVVESVHRLVEAALLCPEPYVGVARHETVHEILRDGALMMVLEHESAIAADTRHRRLERELDRTAAVLQRLERLHPRRNEPQRQTGAIHRERQLRREPLRIPSELLLGDGAVAVGIDQAEHLRKDLDAGREAQLQDDALLLDRDGRGLEILVHAVREYRARDGQEKRSGADDDRSHRAVYLRP